MEVIFKIHPLTHVGCLFLGFLRWRTRNWDRRSLSLSNDLQNRGNFRIHFLTHVGCLFSRIFWVKGPDQSLVVNGGH